MKSIFIQINSFFEQFLKKNGNILQQKNKL